MKLKSLVFALIFLLRIFSNNDIINYIKDNYGEEGRLLFRKYNNSVRKLKKLELDLTFLIKCKVYNTIPKFLQFKLYKKTLQSAHFYKQWQAKLLNHEIQDKKRCINKLTQEVRELEAVVSGTFTWLDHGFIVRHVNSALADYEKKTMETHKKKLNNLGIYNEIAPCCPDKVVFNYSKLQLSFRMRTLLAYGLDFCLPVYKLNFYKYFLPIESLVSRLKFLKLNNDVNFSEFLNKLHAISHKYFYNFNSYKVFSAVFTKKDVSDIRNLSRNNEIIVCKPDKGRAVVILNKSDYITSMTKIISDVTKFIKIDTDVFKYTVKIEDKINNFLRKLKNLKLLGNEVYNELYCSGTSPGVLYGLPKIHKNDFSSKFQFRPIFAAYNSPCYKISKFLVRHLSIFAVNNYTIDNSTTFVSQLSEVPYDNNVFMASFDVTNLYTNVPLGETINIILNTIFINNVNTFIGLTRELLKTLLELAVTNSFFIFNNQLYKQSDGLGMGLPLAPCFANIFMSHYEKIFLNNCPNEFAPIFYRRYVDDTFVLFREQNHAVLFFDYINKQHPNLSFTMEQENNSSLSFLDVLITKTRNSFSTSVFRKPTNSSLTTSFFSFCSYKFKINSISTLLSRAYNVSSSYQLLHKELQFIINLFSKNGFPKQLIETQISKFFDKKYNHQADTIDSNQQKLYVSLQYFGKQSEKLKHELTLLLNQYFSNISFQFILNNSLKLSTFFSYKDKLTKGMLSSVIYKYSCVHCTSEYIGSTSRLLNIRVAEHAGLSFRTNRPLTNVPNSNIYDHANSCNSPVNLNQFSILDSSHNKKDLLILESLYIHKFSPALNNSQTAHPLHIVNK